MSQGLWTSVLALGLAQPTAAETPAAEPARYEVFYRVNADVRNVELTADLRAGGRLAVSAETLPDSGRRLRLIRPLADPWKLYWVDPAGPAGDEVKYASEVTLDEGSWEALDHAEAEVRERGRATHERWQQATDNTHAFDGAFAFVVIGPPEGRFNIDLAPGGRLRGVRNRLTSRWQPGPFDRFLTQWAGPRFEGYWFWNEGEDQPPHWEPHTYHALEEALELLALPPLTAVAGAPSTDDLRWDDAPSLAVEVLTTLASRAARRLTRPAAQGLTPRPLPGKPDDCVSAVAVGDGARVQRTTCGPEGAAFPESDRVLVSLAAPGGRLVVEVGYRPLTEPLP